MPQKNKKIDKYFKSQKRKANIVAVFAVVPLLAFLLWFAMPPMGEVSELRGTVKNLTGVPTDMGDKLYMMVALENGDEVRVFIPRVTSYKKGREVNLIKIKPISFGRIVYKLKNYVN